MIAVQVLVCCNNAKEPNPDIKGAADTKIAILKVPPDFHAGTQMSKESPMLPGLISRLNGEELRDLLAYLKAGGNKQDTIFSTKMSKN